MPGGIDLTTVPPPNPLYPGLNQQAQSQATSLGASSTSALQGDIANGNPSNVGPMFQALLAAQQPLVQQGQSQIVSQFAASGLGSGSPLMSQLGQYQTNVQNDFLSTLANYTYNASESAANRQLSAAQYGSGLLSGMGGTTYQPYIASPSQTGSDISAGISGIGSIFQMLALMGISI
jgi:hypothetical protein